MSRKVVPTRQVYHLWANQAQPCAYNARRSASFDGSRAKSYDATIARIVENDAGRSRRSSPRNAGA